MQKKHKKKTFCDLDKLKCDVIKIKKKSHDTVQVMGDTNWFLSNFKESTCCDVARASAETRNGKEGAEPFLFSAKRFSFKVKHPTVSYLIQTWVVCHQLLLSDRHVPTFILGSKP